MTICSLVIGGCAQAPMEYDNLQAPERSALSERHLATDAQTVFDSGLAKAAKLNYADAERDFIRAADAFGELGNRQRQASAVFWQAFSVEKQGRTDEARQMYRDMVESFPDSPSTSEAQRRLGLKAATN